MEIQKMARTPFDTKWKSNYCRVGDRIKVIYPAAVLAYKHTYG